MSRTAVVDVGSNATRLLVASVAADGTVVEHERRGVITRLGDGVQRSGRLDPAAIDRVLTALDGFTDALSTAHRRVAVMTSAVRDAGDGAAFAARLADRYDLDARILGGDEEARLGFAGATSTDDPGDPRPVLVIDIGGGSTELVVGARREVHEAVSLQLGVVRMAEHAERGLDALRLELRAALTQGRPRAPAERAIAVSGTPTTLAAIDGGPTEGHVLTLDRIEELTAALAAMPLAERRTVPGLHPDRAPTIVLGAVLLAEVLRSFGLNEVRASHHDLLRGVALALAP